MAQLRLPLLILLLSTFYITGITGTVTRHSRLVTAQHSHPMAFIEASCRHTRYPALCVESLSKFANTTQQSPQQLAQVALSVSLVKARYTREFLSNTAGKMKVIMSSESQGLKLCLDQINDSVDQLSQSIQELRQLARPEGNDPMWHISNVQTWVSTALTDANDCLNGFSGHSIGGKLKATIKGKVLNVAQVTSNALALFNRFAAQYQATADATKKP